MKRFVLFLAMGLASLTACGGDDDGGGSGGSSGSGGSATGGSGGSATGGAAGSGGSATGGAAGSGGSATGGAAGSGGSATGGAAGSGGSATGGTGGSGTGGSATGGTGGTSACNSLVNDGADIPETAETGTPPTMTGGSIADGTYVLTARKDWQGSCNCTSRQKLSISGTTAQVVMRTDKGADGHLTSTWTVAGNKLTSTVTCPTALTKVLEFTATATELQMYDPDDKSLGVYTKK